MHLGVARLCLDCHEVHEYDRCPACTSEAFAFVTRWIKLDTAAVPRTSSQPAGDSAAAEKMATYRQILQPTPSRSRAGTWLRNGSLVIALGYVARWGWHLANQHARVADDKPRKDPSTP